MAAPSRLRRQPAMLALLAAVAVLTGGSADGGSGRSIRLGAARPCGTGACGAGFQLLDPFGALASEGLFGRFVEPDTVTAHAHDEGFWLVDTYASRAWSMTLDGRLSRL